MRFRVNQSSDKALFRITLEPEAPGTLNTKEKGLKESEIQEQASANEKVKVAVSVGVPFFENYVSRLKSQKKNLPHDIDILLPKYDFHFVSLSCSFVPNQDCRLIWANFGVSLEAFSSTGETLTEAPIAYDMSPNETETKNNKDDQTVNAKLNFNLGVLSGGVSYEKNDHAKDYAFAYGVGEAHAGWTFESTQKRGIRGNKRDLVMLVKTPKNSRIMGKFKVNALAETITQPSIRLVLARSHRESKVFEVNYPLSE